MLRVLYFAFGLQVEDKFSAFAQFTVNFYLATYWIDHLSAVSEVIVIGVHFLELIFGDFSA